MKLIKTYKHKNCERLQIEHPYNTHKEFFYWLGAKPFIRGLKESCTLSDYSFYERYHETTRNV